MWLETAINGFLAGMDWIIINVFFFVNPLLLKLFALSILVLNLSKIRITWLKWLIIILYTLYTFFKITEIKNWVLSLKFEEFIAVLPFVCMLLLPVIAKDTPWGERFLNYQCMIVYYLVVNGIWLAIYPTDGMLIVVLMYCLILFLIAQYHMNAVGDEES